MTSNLATTYENLHAEVLTPVAEGLKSYLAEVLEGVARIDAISTRAKRPESFAGKALKQDAQGNTKYRNPLVQIQDQIGARINVLFLSDFSNVKAAIEDYFHAVEWVEKKPESDMEFSYFGEHYVLKIPDDVILEGDNYCKLY